MTNRDALNDLTKKITSLLPENVQQMQEDLESNIHTLLQNALSKMNLVTREEFDVQTALLQRRNDLAQQRGLAGTAVGAEAEDGDGAGHDLPCSEARSSGVFML